MGFIGFGGGVRGIGRVPQAARVPWEKPGEVQRGGAEPGSAVRAFMVNDDTARRERDRSWALCVFSLAVRQPDGILVESSTGFDRWMGPR